ncbi:MAG: hypothetical protein QME76_09295 [Bacillota bacterium]|nr:hypothetical protein [Bacillota bacterium]
MSFTVQDVLSRVRDPKPAGQGKWLAFCPCHNDGAKQGRRSLSIAESKDGKALLHCFAGCEFKDIIAALGLDKPDPRREREREIVVTYDYRDAGGKLVFQVVRYAPKDFRQRRPDGRGGWTWKVRGIEALPYRLPDLLAALERGEIIFIAEGEKDAENLAAYGLTATCNAGGAGKWTGSHARHFPAGARVVVLPDNDDPGRKHAEQAARTLAARGCRVKVVELPGLPPKGDVSDWLAAGGTKEELLALAEAAPEWTPDAGEEARTDDPLAGTPYTISDSRLCWCKPTRDGPPVILPLCNFTARVERQISRDDGSGEAAMVFSISGTLADGRPLPALAVPAEQFGGMAWPLRWGVNAVVSAGMGAKERLREAVLLLSAGASHERVFTHIGWRQLDGRWVYLHAGGAVGANGEALTVDPESEALRRYVLPLDGDPREGMRASLELLHLAPMEITLPLWAAVWRCPTACLLYPTVVLWLHGATGSFKSTLSALFLSHFGGPFAASDLPASWISTDNTLERQAFLCRDALLVVDDYAPESHPREAAALDKRVNRLVRQIGNRCSRGRLFADMRQRPETPPNAPVISTGEQLPLAVGSVAARILPVRCERDAVDLDRLSRAQAQAGLLPQAMRGYLEWLAPQMDTLRHELPARFAELRAKAQVDGHARLPEAVAHLMLGAELGTRYAQEIGSLSEAEADALREASWEIFLELAREHANTMANERPALRFIRTLDAIFMQGLGHLKDRATGGPPQDAEHWGWKDAAGDYVPGGPPLGWADDGGLYLNPEATWRAVSEYLRAAGGFPLRERALREALAREGILIKDEGGRTTRSLRMDGTKRRVIHLDKNMYLSYLQKAVPAVPETASPTAARDSAEHLSGSTLEKAVPEVVPGSGGGTGSGTTFYETEPVTCSAQALQPQWFEGGGTGGTGCVEREGTKKTGTAPDAGEACSRFEDSVPVLFPQDGNAETLGAQGIEAPVPVVPVSAEGESPMKNPKRRRVALDELP